MVALEKKYKPERIIIEYNGMWNFKNLKLPWHWSLEQQITTIDAFTCISQKRHIVCTAGHRHSARNKIGVIAVLGLIFEDKDGEVNQIFEEDLPYDLKRGTLDLLQIL